MLFTYNTLLPFPLISIYTLNILLNQITIQKIGKKVLWGTNLNDME